MMEINDHDNKDIWTDDDKDYPILPRDKDKPSMAELNHEYEKF